MSLAKQSIATEKQEFAIKSDSLTRATLLMPQQIAQLGAEKR